LTHYRYENNNTYESVVTKRLQKIKEIGQNIGHIWHIWEKYTEINAYEYGK